MSDVDEIVGVMVNASCKIVNGSADLILQVLRALANRQKASNENDKPGLSERAKDALTRKIPGIGKSGEVSLSTLNRDAGGELAEVEVSREDLVQLKKELAKRGVAFHVLKSDDDSVDILFSAKSYGLMESSLKAVAREKLGLSDQQIEEVQKPEIVNLEKLATPDLVAAQEKAITDLTQEGYLGLDWTKDPAQDNLTFSAERGAYDIKASADGTWEVSVMGNKHARGWSGEGVYSAALAAVNASKALEQRASLSNGVDLGKALGAGSSEKNDRSGRATTVEELAHRAEEKVKIENAKLPTPDLSKAEPKVKR